MGLNEFVVVDVETTGLEPEVAELIEVGAVRFVKGIKKDSFSQLIKPTHPIPLNISKLTGIYDADVKDALGEIANMLAGGIKERFAAESIDLELAIGGRNFSWLMADEVEIDFFPQWANFFPIRCN